MALSSDGGTEWVPIVSEIEDTCYHLDTADLDNGTDYIAKIIATDGINTGEDVSDTAFCIGRPEAPTFAEEIIFTGSPAKSMVNLSWSAISEENVMGYNILRRQGKKNDYARINKNIIPAKGSIQTTVSYEYADEDVKSGWLYDYLLIEVETDGKTKHHGPVSIVPRWFYGALNK
jgi:hypothetical protein